MQLEFLDGGDTDRIFVAGVPSLSVTDSGQGWTVIVAADALSCTMSREIAQGNGCKHRFRYIDRAHRAKLAIGCLSIHIANSVAGFRQEGCPEATP